MKIHLLFVGKTVDSYLKEGIDVYLKRIPNYIPVTVGVIPPSASKDINRIIGDESKSIQAKLLPGDFIIVLDERGTEISSRQFADLFSKWMVQGLGRVVFIVGGAYGISDSLKSKASYLFSISRMTFTHQMVRLILVEQIYRAFTIIRNEGYHHD